MESAPTPKPAPQPNLARALLDACAPDGSLDEAAGREIVNEYMKAQARP